MRTFKVTFLDNMMVPQTVDVDGFEFYVDEGALYINAVEDDKLAAFAPGQWLRVIAGPEKES